LYSLDRKLEKKGKESEEGVLLIFLKKLCVPSTSGVLVVDQHFFSNDFAYVRCFCARGRQRASDCVDTLAEAILSSMTNVNWS